MKGRALVSLGPVALLDGAVHDHMSAGKLRKLLAATRRRDLEGGERHA